jgi:hypothetical protein
MSASQIKKLSNEYFSHYENAEYASFMNRRSKGKKKEEFEEEEDYEERICHDIAIKIAKLNPSKYMLNKHPELQDILETI